MLFLPVKWQEHIRYEGCLIERTKCYKLLGVHFDQLLHNFLVDKMVKSVNFKLLVLKYLKRTATYELHKQLANWLN